ncbi:hypothetical protein Tco_0012274 [Tanacetum coccineum]
MRVERVLFDASYFRLITCVDLELILLISVLSWKEGVGVFPGRWEGGRSGTEEDALNRRVVLESVMSQRGFTVILQCESLLRSSALDPRGAVESDEYSPLRGWHGGGGGWAVVVAHSIWHSVQPTTLLRGSGSPSFSPPEFFINVWEDAIHGGECVWGWVDRERAEKEQEANIALMETYDDIQAKIDADHLLAERLSRCVPIHDCISRQFLFDELRDGAMTRLLHNSRHTTCLLADAMIDQGVAAALATRDANRNGDDNHA